MKHADGKRVVEHTLQRQTINVGLNDMGVGKISRGWKCHFDRLAEINGDDVFYSPGRNSPCVTALATAALEHNFPSEEVWRYRRDPIQKLLFVSFIVVSELLP